MKDTFDKIAQRLVTARNDLDSATQIYNDVCSAVAFALRRERERSGVSLRRVAARMKVSAPYLSDLELGRRAWSLELIGRYGRAIAGLDHQPETTL